jgi:hypothetical protein
MNFNYNAPWHPLKLVCLGNTYNELFFRDVRNVKVRELLQKIVRETQEDFDNIQSTLTALGVTVVRPSMDINDTIMNYVDCNDRLTFSKTGTYALIPKPPMQPRDCQLVVGSDFLATNQDIDLYKNSGIDYLPDCNLLVDQQFDSPLITVIGKHLIVDQKDHPGLASRVQKLFPARSIVPVDIGGHNDAVFCAVRPGLLVSSHYKNCYQDSFPNWQVYHIPDQSWNAMTAWRHIKHANAARWWVPEAIENTEFSQFVDQWISHWLGYASETVFDVNMLVINERQIVVNNYHKGLFAWFKKYDIEPIIVKLRHRFFWDGGIHCVTSDLYRQGDSETYISYQ